MQHKRKRLAACLLAVLLLGACAKGSGDRGTPTDSTPSDSAAEQTGEQDFRPEAWLRLDGTYALVRPERASDNTVDIFRSLLKRMSAAAGGQFPSHDDYLAEGEHAADTEILVGKTVRQSSIDVQSALEAKSWRICTVGRTVVIAGADDIALYRAAEQFWEQVTVREGVLYLPRDLELTGSYTVRDNSALLPEILPDSEVTLIPSSSEGDTQTPDWVRDLILVEANLVNATGEGTLTAARRVIDHLAEMGVNGLWVTPVGDRADPQYFYGNLGLHTIDAKLTGTEDYTLGWERFREFVDYAHGKNVRVFLDVVTWGTAAGSDLLRDHPDWYTGGDAWSGKAFDWSNAELREWYAATCTEIVLRTGVDGLRCDCEPETAGYSLFGDIRSRLLAAGRKIVIFSEHSNTRDGAFDFEQFGVFNYKTTSFGDQQELKRNWLTDTSIVAAVRQSKMIGDNVEEIRLGKAYYRFFTYCVSCHDFKGTAVKGDLLTLAYQALFAPFVPIWYLGEEFGWESRRSLLYDRVNWSDGESPENFLFCETVKEMIALRRTYAGIFSAFPEDHRKSNICAVQAEGFGSVTAYARFADGVGILILPNSTDAPAEGTVTVPYRQMGCDGGNYTVRDLLTGEVIATGSPETVRVTVKARGLGVYLVEKG